MPQLSLDIPHTLDRDEAARRLRGKIDAVLAEYHERLGDLHQQWQDQTFSFGFKVLGMAVSGKLVVESETVRLSADVPMAAVMFRGAIEERIRKEVGAILRDRSNDRQPS